MRNIRAQIDAFIHNKLVRVVCVIIMVFAIVAFAFFVRMNTFWLPHWKGDQSHYITLAMKLDALGFEHYSLRGVRVKEINLNEEGTIQLVYPYLMKDVENPGELIRAMRVVGIRYYDQKFFHKPPALAYALMFSHRLFAHAAQPYTAVVTNIGDFVYTLKPRVLLNGQFYAVIVPLFFSLALIAVTFFLGQHLFSSRVGLYAAFMMASNPVAIMTAHKVWADDMLAFFVTLSVLLFSLSFPKRKNRFSCYCLLVSASISCGIAVLVKQSAGFIVLVVFLFSIITEQRKIKNAGSVFRVISNKYFLLFLIGVLLVSGFWFIKIYHVSGNPLWIPEHDEVVKTDVSGWFKALEKRPSSWILYLAGTCMLCPLFVFALFSIQRFFKNVISSLKQRAYSYQYILLWLVVLVLYFFMVIIGTKEHRYMLPAYPFLAVLSACVIEDVRRWLARAGAVFGNVVVRECIVIMILAMSAWWSVPIGIQAGIKNQLLLRVPF